MFWCYYCIIILENVLQQLIHRMGSVSSFLHSKTPKEVISSRQVQTKYGVVQGRRIVDEMDLQVDAFLGIPFARPPTGERRFKVLT